MRQVQQQPDPTDRRSFYFECLDDLPPVPTMAIRFFGENAPVRTSSWEGTRRKKKQKMDKVRHPSVDRKDELLSAVRRAWQLTQRQHPSYCTICVNKIDDRVSVSTVEQWLESHTCFTCHATNRRAKHVKHCRWCRRAMSPSYSTGFAKWSELTTCKDCVSTPYLLRRQIEEQVKQQVRQGSKLKHSGHSLRS